MTKSKGHLNDANHAHPIAIGHGPISDATTDRTQQSGKGDALDRRMVGARAALDRRGQTTVYLYARTGRSIRTRHGGDVSCRTCNDSCPDLPDSARLARQE